jgi:hypothetical protein
MEKTFNVHPGEILKEYLEFLLIDWLARLVFRNQI